MLNLALVDKPDWLESLEQNKAIMALPCFDREANKPVALLVFYQVVGVSTSYHDHLPGEDDLPFISLIQGHIEAAIQNSTLHRQLEGSAKLLEERVLERTTQLAQTNNKLEASLLNLKETQSELLEASRKAGISEIATGVLHNVGNVLNSLNVAINTVQKTSRELCAEPLAKVCDLIKQPREQSLAEYLSLDPKGSKIPQFIDQISNQLSTQKSAVLKELTEISGLVEHVKQVISAQQAFAKVGGVEEPCQVEELIKVALNLHLSSHQQSNLKIQCELATEGVFNLNKHKILQILVNLIKNADQAMGTNPPDKRILTISSKPITEKQFIIAVTDLGTGIDPSHLTKIFAQGYSTKSTGHGFGLHSAAIAAQEMGGRLTCSSPGVNLGATFTLTLPLKFAEIATTDSPSLGASL